MTNKNIQDYAKITLKAYSLIIKDGINPREAWQLSAKEVFPNSESSQEKSCPRITFLGLCQEGFLVDIPIGRYTSSINNKNYAIKALKILQKNPSLSKPLDLWYHLRLNEKIQHNHQMDVVLILVQNNLINWGKLK